MLLTRELQGRCGRLNVPFSKDFSPSTFVVEGPEIGEWTLQVRSRSSVCHDACGHDQGVKEACT